MKTHRGHLHHLYLQWKLQQTEVSVSHHLVWMQQAEEGHRPELDQVQVSLQTLKDPIKKKVQVSEQRRQHCPQHLSIKTDR